VSSTDALRLTHTIVEALEEKKGEDILVLDISQLSPIADYFVLVSGLSDRMLETLVEAAHERAKQQWGVVGRVEGTARSGWVLVDFGDVILHAFAPDVRSYYDLEGLWADARVVLHIQ